MWTPSTVMAGRYASHFPTLTLIVHLFGGPYKQHHINLPRAGLSFGCSQLCPQEGGSCPRHIPKPRQNGNSEDVVTNFPRFILKTQPTTILWWCCKSHIIHFYCVVLALAQVGMNTHSSPLLSKWWLQMFVYRKECQFLAADIKAHTMRVCANTSPVSHWLWCVIAIYPDYVSIRLFKYSIWKTYLVIINQSH